MRGINKSGVLHALKFFVHPKAGIWVKIDKYLSLCSVYQFKGYFVGKCRGFVYEKNISFYVITDTVCL